MADDFKDISHLYKVTPSAKTIIDGEDLVETKQKSKAYAWCDVLQSVTGLILGLFLFCHMGFTSSILLGKDTFWSLVSLTGGYFIDGVDHLWMHSVFVGTIFVNTVSGVVTIPDSLVDSARMLHLKRSVFFFRILLPGAMPSILTGASLGLIFNFLLLTAAELIGATEGLGWYVKNFSDFADYGRVIVGIVFIGIVVTSLMWLFNKLERRLLRYRRNIHD